RRGRRGRAGRCARTPPGRAGASSHIRGSCGAAVGALRSPLREAPADRAGRPSRKGADAVPAPRTAPRWPSRPRGIRGLPGGRSEAQAKADARALSDELHALLREEAERVWTRWTTGAGPLPSGALAQHPRLFLRESLAAASTALAHASTPEDRFALRLLHAE